MKGESENTFSHENPRVIFKKGYYLRGGFWNFAPTDFEPYQNE